MSIVEKTSETILSRTYRKLHDNPLTNIGCTVALVNENIYHWKCSLIGPNDSIYKKGLFRLFIKFPKDFPFSGPEVIFDTPIYHLNVNPKKGKEPLGHICLSTINFWTPDSSIEDLLVSIFALFYVANSDSPYGIKIKEEFEKNRKLYDYKAEFFTKKYAVPKKASDRLDKWDFSINDDEIKIKNK